MNTADLPLWIVAMSWASRLILVLLVGLSMWSIATMLRCRRKIREACGDEKRDFADLQNLVRQGKVSEIAKSGAGDLYAGVAREVASVAQEPLQIDRSVRSLLVLKRTEIEKDLTILATLGSNAPFIGLFGTVLGIIQAFGALGSRSGGSAAIMVGISEALVATAIGLFVAIPAVIAFNFLSRQLRVLMTNCESLRDLYVAQLKK